MREVRSNSLQYEDRSPKKVRQRQTSVGTFSVLSPMTKLQQKVNIPNPEAYFSRVPVINVPTEEYVSLHRKFCVLQINAALAKIERFVKEPTEKIVEISMKTSALVQDTSNLLAKRQSYEGRGLNENREMFFLIAELNRLKVKESSLQTRDFEVMLEYYISMQNFLKNPPDFEKFHITINLDGYMKNIPQHKDKLDRVHKKISYLEHVIKTPSYTPPPDDFEEQLIYPTSSTFTIFKTLEKKARKKKLHEVYDELKSMTDEPEELAILLNHAFTFAWRKADFPFCEETGEDIPAFLHCKVSVFDPQYIDEEYLNLEINELRFSDWPFAPVVDVLDELFFMINPFDGAKKFYTAMDVAAKCVAKVTGEETYVDFDTLFPLIFISVLATGLLMEPRILIYISQLSLLDYSDSHVTFAASYVEAILTHIRGLDVNGKPISEQLQEAEETE